MTQTQAQILKAAEAHGYNPVTDDFEIVYLDGTTATVPAGSTTPKENQ